MKLFIRFFVLAFVLISFNGFTGAACIPDDVVVGQLRTILMTDKEASIFVDIAEGSEEIRYVVPSDSSLYIKAHLLKIKFAQAVDNHKSMHVAIFILNDHICHISEAKIDSGKINTFLKRNERFIIKFNRAETSFVYDIYISSSNPNLYDNAEKILDELKAVNANEYEVFIVTDEKNELFEYWIQPISGNMNNANEVRRALQPLVDFAADNDCAVLGITHFKKGSAGSNAQERVIGSQAFAALARMVLVAAQQEGKEARALARAKSNIASDHGGFEYTIEQTAINTDSELIDTTYAVWGNSIAGAASEILGAVEEEEKVSALDEAKNFLCDILCDGEMSQKKIEAAASNIGISLASIKRAKKELQIKSRKMSMNGPWFWELPDALE